MNQKVKIQPVEIQEEYQSGTNYKSSLGDKGLFEQTKRNERFYIGDQWYGAQTGNSRPLIRRNILKRIGEYKMSSITAAPVTAQYSAEGIPNTADMQDKEKMILRDLENGVIPQGEAEAPEIAAITSAMTDYFKITAERIKFDKKKEQLLRNAFISGTGVLFTYWDSDIETGLYADAKKSTPIRGDIACEVLDIENVVFGDPNNDDVQAQPFIIISQRKQVEDVKREARRNHLSDDYIIEDREDGIPINSGDRGNEPNDSKRVTVYTKIYKEYDQDDKSYKVYAVKTTGKATVREPWDLKLKNYPLAIFQWERRRSSIYGESEITYLIPNQIAINRAMTAAVWGLMAHGMPIMLVNGDVVTQPITNDPGQIIKVFGSSEDVQGAARYLIPPNAAGQFQGIVNDLSKNTLADSGANEAALGDVRPDNASAIIQMREAAMAPLQVYMNRFYDFIEDVARIWADFWLNLYGERQIGIEDSTGKRYLLFRAERYKHLLITARVDVGAATLYSEAVVVSTLDALRNAGIINDLQYLERLPKNIIPNKQGLIDDIKDQMAAQQQMMAEAGPKDEEILQQFAAEQPELFAAFQQMSPEEQAEMMAQIRGSMQSAAPVPGAEPGAVAMPNAGGTPIGGEV